MVRRSQIGLFGWPIRCHNPKQPQGGGLELQGGGLELEDSSFSSFFWGGVLNKETVKILDKVG